MRWAYGVGIPDGIGDVEHESEDDDGKEGDVELEQTNHKEEDPSDGELRVPEMQIEEKKEAIASAIDRRRPFAERRTGDNSRYTWLARTASDPPHWQVGPAVRYLIFFARKIPRERKRQKRSNESAA